MAKGFTVTFVKALKDGTHADPATKGLYLRVRGNSRIWVFRYSRQNKAYSINLGSLAQVGLAEARAKVAVSRGLLVFGRDPADSPFNPNPPKRGRTFREDSLTYFDYREREWDAQHASIWLNSVKNHAWPLIGDRDTASLTVADLVAVLQPLWTTKHHTAIRLHGRLKCIIEHAMDCDDHGLFQHGNPADRVLKRLPRGVATESVPHRALPWQDAPALYRRLCGLDDRAAVALRFLLLCCCPRAAEVYRARWDEIDLSDGPFGEAFHVPADRVKSGKPRTIPLSRAAIELLDELPRINGYLFPANRRGKTINGVYHPFAGHLFGDAMGILLRDLGVPSTLHGLRSTFRVWVTDHALTVQDHDAAEIALDHVIGTKVSRSYDRSDLLVQRRDLAERWSQFLIS